MLGTESVMGEQRAMYESFDCAQAVALIGFIGLLSNFQDTIEEFTELLNNGRRRRRSNETPLEGWKDVLYSALETFGYGTKPLQPPRETGVLGHFMQQEEEEEEEEAGQFTRSGPTNNTAPKGTLQDALGGSDWPWSPNTEGERHHLLQDLAHTGPVLAMWLVDTGDGRVTGEEGRAGVCRASRSLASAHGWLGYKLAQVLTNTLATALSQHQDSRDLLDRAGLSAGTVTC